MEKRSKLSCLPSTSKSSSSVVRVSMTFALGSGGTADEVHEEDRSPPPRNGNGGNPADPPHLAPGPVNGGMMTGMAPHPLYIPHILTNIFKYCSAETLASARLVCSTWKDSSLPAWRSSATLQFQAWACGYNVFVTSTTGAVFPVETWTLLPEFLKFWEANCSKKPFHRFGLTKWESGRMIRRIPEGHMSNIFWKSFGSFITTLTLRDCSFPAAPVLGNIVCPACPNLRDLTLDGCSYENEQEYERQHGEPEQAHLHLQSLSIRVKEWAGRYAMPVIHIPGRWLELLSLFPALKSLTLSLGFDMYGYSTYKVLMDQLLTAIKILRTGDVNKLPIQQFRVNFDVDFEHLLLASSYVMSSESERELFMWTQELELPWEGLAVLHFNLSKDDVVIAMEMVAANKTALRKLVAREEPGDLGTDVWGFPFATELPNLEGLAMSHRFCGSMDFLKYTPKLKDLRIYRRQTLYTDLYESRSWDTQLVSRTFQPGLAHVKLLDLKELHFEFLLNEGDLRSLIGWLPNVEKLSTYLNDSQFAIVCDQWRGLTHLHVLGGRLTDVGTTGSREGEGTGEISPNILLLKGLKSFGVPGRDRSEFTDVSAFEGFLKLPDLWSLDILSKHHKFGDQAIMAMRSKIPNCKLPPW